jgi:hypothetical protein
MEFRMKRTRNRNGAREDMGPTQDSGGDREIQNYGSGMY